METLEVKTGIRIKFQHISRYDDFNEIGPLDFKNMDDLLKYFGEKIDQEFEKIKKWLVSCTIYDLNNLEGDDTVVDVIYDRNISNLRFSTTKYVEYKNQIILLEEINVRNDPEEISEQVKNLCRHRYYNKIADIKKAKYEKQAEEDKISLEKHEHQEYLRLKAKYEG